MLGNFNVRRMVNGACVVNRDVADGVGTERRGARH